VDGEEWAVVIVKKERAIAPKISASLFLYASALKVINADW
jgi:hypothetical protein